MTSPRALAAPGHAVLAVLAALAALAAVAITGCSVHRQSERFVCGNDGDCADGRTCDHGFCVERQCPAVCTTCNLSQQTCRIDCNANRPCSAIQCPVGFACDVRCNNSGSCSNIDCAQARSCEISCSGAGACGGINCGKTECAIDCTGAGACPAIDCVDSCACDVDCSNSVACPSMMCPSVLGTLCTRSGQPGAVCDSSVSVVCDTCF